MSAAISSVFRIEKRTSRAVAGAPAPSTAAAPGASDMQAYLERLMKLIPSEVIALYLVGAGFIQPDQPWVLLGWAVFGLFAVVLVRARGTTNPETGEGPQWAAVAISATSYVLWLYSLGGPFAAFPGHDLHEPAIASLLVLAWTFVVPYFYRG